MYSCIVEWVLINKKVADEQRNRNDEDDSVEKKYYITYVILAIRYPLSATDTADQPQVYLKNIILINSCAVPYYLSTIASTSNWLTANIKSHCGCPTNSKCLLWLHRSMHHSTHKPFKFYLSSVYSPKFSKIYRCWIVWGKKKWIAIIPSFLAITLLGQLIYLHLNNPISIQVCCFQLPG